MRMLKATQFRHILAGSTFILFGTSRWYNPSQEKQKTAKPALDVNLEPRKFITTVLYADDNKSAKGVEFPENSAPTLSSYLTGFRSRLIGEYENRLRKHSSPQKVFEYFASANGQMTPEDLVRALTPFTPGQDETVLGSRNFKYSFSIRSSAKAREKYKEMCKKIQNESEEPFTDGDRKQLWSFRHSSNLSYEDHLSIMKELKISNQKLYGENSLISLVDLSGDGLISYPEFQMLKMLLFVKESSMENLFSTCKETDEEGLTREEFLTFLERLQRVHFGKTRLRRWKTNTLGYQDNDGASLLCAAIFEKQAKSSVTFESFFRFVSQVRLLVHQLAFIHFDKERKGYLSGYQFASLVIALYGKDQHREELLANASILKGKNADTKEINLHDTYEFVRLMRQLDHVASLVENPCTRSDFVSWSEENANVQLSHDIADIIFILLRDNLDLLSKYLEP
mmetsp:Transcript_2894/g.3914  ORF Transcript_2894/g.3914 Transcript_2894/m.3914 type:complete len:454 (+) Transcript_2894:140-1501(+)